MDVTEIRKRTEDYVAGGALGLAEVGWGSPEQAGKGTSGIGISGRGTARQKEAGVCSPIAAA